MAPFFQKYFKYLLLAALIYFPLFGHLTNMPLRIWDEARLAISAYEMLHNHDYITVYFDGEPDMWSTKPPLQIWIQVLFMKLFGVNEFSVRLPSAFAALATCIALMVISLRYLKSFWFGFIAVLILVTSSGYPSMHGTRTGDYDALLTLLTMSSGFFFFAFCETRKNKFLYFFFIGMALAVLTKSITGLMFGPAILVYSIVSRQFLPLLRNKHFYLSLLSFFVIAGGYYLVREMHNPGYLEAVQQNEWGGRFMNKLESHGEPFDYYYNNFIEERFSAWYLLFPCGLVIGLAHRNIRLRRLTLFATLMSLCFFLVISSAQTKIAWYDLPLYPFLAVISAAGLFFIFQLLQASELVGRLMKHNVVPYVFLFLVCIGPYRSIIDKNFWPQELSWEKDFYDTGYYLKQAIDGRYNLDGQYLLYGDYNAHNRFYIFMLNEKGVRISIKDWKDLKKGDTVIVSQDYIERHIKARYHVKPVSVVRTIRTFRIDGLRPDAPAVPTQ